MSQSKFRRVFSQDFRHGAVELMSAGEGASALARELGVLRKSLYEWKDKYAENGLPCLARQAGRAARAMPGVVPIVEPAVASRGELLRARAHIEELELDFFELPCVGSRRWRKEQKQRTLRTHRRSIRARRSKHGIPVNQKRILRWMR